MAPLVRYLAARPLVLAVAYCASVLMLSCSDGAGSASTSAASSDAQPDSSAEVALFDMAVDTPEPGTDAAPELPSAPDVAAKDAAADTSNPTAGCAGCACATSAECDSGMCLETDKGKQCAKLCQSGCPAGTKCVQLTVPGADLAEYCVPAFPRLCEPCQADSDCNNVVGGTDSRCVGYVDPSGSMLGNFCAVTCQDSSECPGGYSCQERTSVGGVKSKQCIKTDLVCACDSRATKLGLSTACSNANAAGTCQGKRTCGEVGLSACSAPSAVTESCNQKDDNCNGQTDEPGSGVCDDGQFCTYDNCISGECQHPGKLGPCEDGTACSTGDQCENGVCKGIVIACDDKNPCTVDTCDPIKGCVTSQSENAKCSDSNACTVGDACKGGFCLPGAATTCDDANPCTTDTCDPKSGCAFVSNSAACDDGSICTYGDACSGGTCAPGKPLPCADGNPCTDDSCDPKTGCVFAANSAACSDNNACTVGDGCAAGTCNPGAAKDCDDGNPCTTNTCDPKSGCTTSNNSLPCTDNNLCTDGDLCKNGGCAAGGLKSCDDGNVCTTDVCDSAKGCLGISNAEACSDDNQCTIGDQCSGGKCAPGKSKACDDGEPCTDNLCEPGQGCFYPNSTSPCDDGSVCTAGDVCQGGACKAGIQIGCDDGNPCTDDSCDPKKACLHLANSALCSDGNDCTVSDACVAKLCIPGKAKACDDGLACTDDSCHPILGCQFLNNVAPCDDGQACTTGDFCKSGLCKGGPALSCDDGNQCTDDSCDPKQACLHAANSAQCSDNNACTSGDTCAAKLCVPGKATVCNDSNPCTDDTCAPATGCAATNNTATCNDNSFCTDNDVCSGGVCKGAPISCDDGNPCTTESCLPPVGCQFANNTLPCNDGSACTGSDVCSAGKCKGANLCDANATCTGSGASAACKCNSGYTGDGFSCSAPLCPVVGAACNGSDANHAAISCLQLFASGITAPGVYWVKPDANPAFQVTCVNADYNGYTLIANLTRVNGLLWANIPTAEGAIVPQQRLTDARINAIWGSQGAEKRMLVRCEGGGTWGSALANNWYGGNYTGGYSSNCNFSYGATIGGWPSQGVSWYQQNGNGQCLHGSGSDMSATGTSVACTGNLQFLIR